MMYRNLDPETPRRLRHILRWQLQRRRLPPPPATLSLRPAVFQNDGAALCTGRNTLTWIGHAGVVIQLDGQTIVCDPVWSPQIPGGIRRIAGTGLALEVVPRPDAILISHNHYDHLDLPTLRRFGGNTRLLVPAGLSAYFARRGFRRAEEFGWWDSTRLGALRITVVPAQHWSRRTPFDTNRSWWGGWVIEGSQRLYFAGDTAFFSGLGHIARQFPALDWVLLPIGAYDPPWIMRSVHMNPEEAGAAFALLGARRMLPIHWGTIRVTDEPTGEPVARLRAWWAARHLASERLWLPDLGETGPLDDAAML